MKVNKRGVIVSCSVLVLAALVVVATTQAHAIKNQLNAWKLLPQPEPLTELYFTHPNNLPSTFTSGQSQTVSFTVHNIEYKTEVYPYSIVETSNNGAQSVTLANGSFTLQQNQYEKINRPATISDLGSRVKVEVNLPSVNESIDYWLNRSGS
jgi:hypothetical protein